MNDTGTALFLEEHQLVAGTTTHLYAVTLASTIKSETYICIKRETQRYGTFCFDVFLTTRQGSVLSEIILVEPERDSDSFEEVLQEMGFKTIQSKVS